MRNLVLLPLRHKISSSSCCCASDPTRFHEFLSQESYKPQEWRSQILGLSLKHLEESQFIVQRFSSPRAKQRLSSFAYFYYRCYSKKHGVTSYSDPGIAATTSGLKLLPKSQETSTVPKYSSTVHNYLGAQQRQ